MKEKLNKITEKIKGLWLKVKEQLKKINVIKKTVDVARAHRVVLSVVFFCIVMLALILIPTLAWSEFVVPVCVLMVLEVAMAVMLHKTELWIHGVLLLLHIVIGAVIGRVPMMVVCVAAYLLTTLTLQLGFKKEEVVEVPVQEEKKPEKPKKKNKKK